MSFEAPDPLRLVAQRDGLYSVEAYRFVFEALAHTLRMLKRDTGHVSGRDLLEGIRDKALQDFGGLARIVLNGWGVKATDDFGRIVFSLVDASLMGKTDNDSVEDFHAVYDFETAFPTIDQLRKTKKK